MKTFNLNGKWTVRQAGQTKLMPAVVPGDVYADLLRNGEIPDPFFRDNEKKLQWIGETDWIYSKEFSLDESFFKHERIILTCNGLDTLATVTLNDRKIAETDNMFRTYEWDIKPFLITEINRIEIYFKSTIPYALKKQKDHYLPCWGIGKKEYDKNWVMNIPHKVNISHGWIRKEQCNFGWDWGLMAVTCGIWRDIKITAFNTAIIKNVYIKQQHIKNRVNLLTEITLDAISNKDITANITVSHNKLVKNQKIQFSKNKADTTFTLDTPSLWWPAGMGDQPLYKVKIELVDSKNNILDTISKKIGLRTVKLERNKDKWGESFFFSVNGQSFFAKGANWIPSDGIIGNMQDSRYRILLQSAVEANMNMIRVWGGGIYEKDIFYDICDELGLLVWQDFMFACSTYPTYDDNFIETVKEELKDNIKRLRHHPCIALWCGNNELEQGLVGRKWTKETMSWKDYSRLYDRIMPETIKRLDRDTDYWPASPHSPIGDRTDFNNPTCGDSHLWDVWHGKKPFEWYRTTNHRFVSEFGFQSFPEPKTINSFTLPEDRNITSYIMEYHQRSDIGNSTIMHYMLDWFRLPLGFENTIWVSQIQQAMAMKYAVEHWRRNMPRSMGAIYWQLNDTWPAPSWSSIDYFCRRKALHYIAKKFFEPIMISGVENLNLKELEIHITSDLYHKIPVKVICEITDLNGKILYSAFFDTETPTSGNIKIRTLSLKEIIDHHGSKNILIWLELQNNDKETISTNFINLEKPKYLELKRPNISIDISECKNDSYEIILKTDTPALWTWLELKNTDAKFSDNFFHLRPNKTLKIIITPNKKITKNELENQLIIRSLIDTY